MLKVYDDASHMGTSDIGQENFNNCEVYGFLDYLVYEASNDCKYWLLNLHGMDGMMRW